MNMVWRSGAEAPFNFEPYTRWRLGARSIHNGHFSSWERASYMYWMGVSGGQIQSGHFREEKNLLSLPETGFLACSLVTVPATIPWLLTNHMVQI